MDTSNGPFLSPARPFPNMQRSAVSVRYGTGVIETCEPPGRQAPFGALDSAASGSELGSVRHKNDGFVMSYSATHG